MNHTWTIAARELHDRRRVLATAAVLALLPFATLLLPGVRSHGAGTVLATAGGLVAGVYILGLALVLGATFVGSELTDKRLSFYFSKPVASAAIWFGKVAGVLATIALAAAIILVPVMLAAGGEWDTAWRGATPYLFLAAFSLFLISHTVATMMRARSALVVFDVAAAVVAAAILYVLGRVLAAGDSERLVLAFAATVGASVLVTMAAAGAWQLSRGRTDQRANHRELSRFLWSGVAAIVIVASGAVLWVVNVTPDDFGESVFAAQMPAGDWLPMLGTARNRLGYRAAFFLNVKNGAYKRIDSPRDTRMVFVARNGMAGVVNQAEDRRLDLVRFRDAEVAVVPTNVSIARGAYVIVSDDATRVAVFDANLLTVHTLPEGRTAAAVRLPAMYVLGYFVTPEVLRLYAHERNLRFGIFEFDTRTRRLSRTGELAGPGDSISIHASHDGSRVLVRKAGVHRKRADELSLVDGRSGAVVAHLPPQRGTSVGSILSDGRIAVLELEKDERALAIYRADLTLQHRIALPRLGITWLKREEPGGRLILGGFAGLGSQERDATAWTIVAVDTHSGQIVRTMHGVRPAISYYLGSFGFDPRAGIPEAATPLIVFDADGKLKRVVL